MKSSFKIMLKKLICPFLFLAGIVPLFGEAGFYENLADAAFQLTMQKVEYDPKYYRIGYPNGDVPPGKGVCTDVVIRAYRKMKIDLQKEIHEDMLVNFKLYPKNWGLKRPDSNIDHRRVPNLMTFFSRHGTVKKISAKAEDYLPGDIVCWNLGKGVQHIGLVSKRKDPSGQRHMIVHNIGAGQVLEDCLFSFKIIGHYRYEKASSSAPKPMTTRQEKSETQ